MKHASVELAALRRPAFLRRHQLHHGVSDPVHLTDSRQRDLITRLAQGATPLHTVARILKPRRPTASSLDHLREVYSSPGNLVALVRLQLKAQYDLILVEQGYGGVYVHSYELAKWFRRQGRRVLVLSPEDPLFESGRHPDDVTLRRLTEIVPHVDYFTYVQVLRGLVEMYRPPFLLIAHRSQSVLLFDLIARQPTVIYCDGYLDGGFDLARRSGMAMSPRLRERILIELQYLTASSGHGFFSVFGGPNINRYLLAAGYHAMVTARQNWFWGQQQFSSYVAAMPQLRDSSRLVLPFTQPRMFRRDHARRARIALFTTTMHNIEMKGFPELVKLMHRVPDLRVRCVVRQRDKLPDYPKELNRRLEIGHVSKPEMIDLYHRVWCNVRTSREESSPLSVLESMTCEVPQVVSPRVAEQIPIIEDGCTGYVVEPDDADRLEWCVRRLMKSRSLRDNLGAEARRRAVGLATARRRELFTDFLEGV